MEFEIYPEVSGYVEAQNEKAGSQIIKKLEYYEKFILKELLENRYMKSLNESIHEVIIGPHRFLGPVIRGKCHLILAFRKSTTKTPLRHIASASRRANELELI